LCSIRDTDEEQEAAAALATSHFKNAKGMTDKMAGFSALASMDGKGAAARDEAIQKFYDDADGVSISSSDERHATCDAHISLFLLSRRLRLRIGA